MEPPQQSKPERTPSAAARALRLLARREHTRRELADKLEDCVADRAELEALLDDFTERGWLSEARVVEQVVNAKGARLGPLRIRKVLLGRGVPEALIAPAIEKLKATELEAARAVWRRKFRAATSAADQARQVRFLQGRGFSFEVAMRVTRAGVREDDQQP